MGAMASRITSITIVYSTVYSVNFPHKWPVAREMFPFDDVIMNMSAFWLSKSHFPLVKDLMN